MPSLDYQPQVLVNTSSLSREEWLEYRRRGIGGSDVAAVFGLSPYLTARDLYYDKIGVATPIDDEGNWVQLEVGKLLEELVAKIFSLKIGRPVYKIQEMFYHPQYPFMLADVDFFVDMPNNQTAILETKTTHYNNRSQWWDGESGIVPKHYELQVRHYMSVLNLNLAFTCCLYANSEDDVVIRRLERDMDMEQEMIYLEKIFWENHVQTRVQPPYTECGDLVLQSVERQMAIAEPIDTMAMLDTRMQTIIERYMALQKQKDSLSLQMKAVENAMKKLKATILMEMGSNCKAACGADSSYIISNTPTARTTINKENLERLRLLRPDIYEEYATTSTGHRFSVKTVKPEKAAA